MWKSVLLSVVLASCGAVSGASLFFTGTPPTLGSGTTTGLTSPIFSCCGITFSAAAGFSVPAGPSYSLLNIQVMVVSDGNGASPLSALLYKDSGGNPAGAPVADLSTTICPCPNGVSETYTLLPSAPTTLDASTTYWLVMTSTPADSRNISWRGAAEANPYSGVFSYAGARETSTSGLPNTTVSRNLIFSVDGNAITAGTPEPASMLMIASGIALLARFRRHLAK